jgi:UDP-N-acetylglucosamine 2-epimerase
MSLATAMVGNSSSGINEAPSLRLPVVNIGPRQQGRMRAANVVDVECKRTAIETGIAHATSDAFRDSLRELESPYGDGHAAERIVDVLANVPINERLLIKPFYQGAI